MPTITIELNDAGIIVLDAPDATPTPSPGYALVDGDDLLTGLAAAGSARLKPRWVNHTFWHHLNTDPLPHPFPRRLSHADLAHAHLQEIWQGVSRRGADVILAPMGGYSEHQLGLALGIARACKLRVCGLVDGAVAAAANAGEPEHRLLHLDLGLHQAVLTELTQAGEIVRARVEASEQTGLASLRETWMKSIAELFVRHTRLDPLHGAETEQRLFNRLPRWLSQLRREEETTAVLEAGGKEHSVDLTRSMLISAAKDSYQHLEQLVRLLLPNGKPSALLLSSRVAELPGLESLLAERLDGRVVCLDAGAAARGALRMQEHIRASGEELPFVLRLPVGGSAFVASPATVVPDTTPESNRGRVAPTHILHQGRAWSISSRPFVLGLAVPAGQRGLNLAGATAGISRSHCMVFEAGGRVLVEDSSRYGTFVNGERVEGKRELAAGDLLRLGAPGIELLLIAVVGDNEATNG